MRPILPMFLLLAAVGCGEIDLSGIGDWGGGGDGGGDGGGWGGDCCPTFLTIRPVVTPDITFSPGSAFQLQVRDLQGNPVVDPPGQFSSVDTTVLAVSPTGWAEARSSGSTNVLYGEGGGLIASTTFFVGLPPSNAALRLEVHGTQSETAEGNPIIEGWIGHTIDTRGVSLDFIGADGLQPTDQVSASPLPLAWCEASDACISLSAPSPAHAWSPGENTLCIGVTVGDSVPAQGRSDANNREWVVTWSRPGLFILRRTIHVWVQTSLGAPASAC